MFITSIKQEQQIRILGFQFTHECASFIIILKDLLMGRKKNKEKSIDECDQWTSKKEEPKDESKLVAKKKHITKSSYSTRLKKKLNKVDQQQVQGQESSNLKQESQIQQSGFQPILKLKLNLEQQVQHLKRQQLLYKQEEFKLKTLKISISTRKENISILQKNIYQAEADIINNLIKTDKLLFFSTSTFKDNEKFDNFYQNLLELSDKIQSQSFSNLFDSSLRLKKITSGLVSQLMRALPSKDIKKEVVYNHFNYFPYIAFSEDNFQILQSLVLEQEINPDLQLIDILKNIPSLFMRSSQFSDKLKATIQNYTYNIIYNDKSEKIIKGIQTIINSKFPRQEIKKQEIQEIISKGLLNREYICLPQIKRQIRGFSFSRKIYINTYYLERLDKCLDEVKHVYAILILIRQIANYVYDELVHKLQLEKRSIEEVIAQGLERRDYGAQLQRLLTQGSGFKGIFNGSLELLKQQNLNFAKFNNFDQTHLPVMTFYEFEKEKKSQIAALSSKYINKKIFEENKSEKELQEKHNDENLQLLLSKSYQADFSHIPVNLSPLSQELQAHPEIYQKQKKQLNQ